jgi:hypothetical protein
MADKLFLRILGRLDEAQARWYVAREAIALGRGGIQTMQRLTGMSKPTILRGIRELTEGDLPEPGRVRRPGGGRVRSEEHDPGLTKALARLMDRSTAGDPMSPLRWTHKSTRTIAEELSKQGHAVSYATVRRRLHERGYSLQLNVKDLEGESSVDRDEQFHYINAQVKRHLSRGAPVISVDTKKRENVGNFKNPGKTWRPKGQPEEVLSHDFPDLGEGPAIPFGAYDVERNEGFVNVGTSRDTSEFAVESIRRWWKLVGRRHYPEAKDLLICADSGGSNGSRRRTWKYYLQKLADKAGLNVTVCHYPPGTSKWNKIEHRMFSFISMNWRGKPLVNYESVVNLISGTKTKTGLRIRAKLDPKEYETGQEVSDDEMAQLRLEPHDTFPAWNYTLRTRSDPPPKHSKR